MRLVLILSRIMILLLILLNILVAALMYKSESLMQALFSSLMVTGKIFSIFLLKLLLPY